MIFQFITICYNQSQCLVDHLESIKYQVITYGEGYLNEILVFDDCSDDSTVEILNTWKRYNSEIFNDIKINVNEKNLGIKINYLNALKYVEGNNYSFLAADDLYGPNNVYDFINFSQKKHVVFSPNVTIINNFFLRDFHYLKLKINHMYSKNSLLSKINRLNIFSAPGAHINFELVNKEEYFQFLIDSEGDVYEDYPSWKYFFLIKKYSVNFYHTEVIFYRPKFNSISENYFKLHFKIKIKFVISNLLFYIIYFLGLDSLIGMNFNNINDLKSFYYNMVRKAKIFY